MDKIVIPGEKALGLLQRVQFATDRRTFLQMAGASVALIIAGCSDSTSPTTTVDLGSGDTGVLNYAYALEQLEAAFYTKVVSSFYASSNGAELSIFTDIRDHEIVHREFFKAALGASAITSLEVDFSTIDFTSRDSVLATAKTFEDLGVAAYNGAGKLLSNPANLLIAGKIVSVEARHAAIIRDLISPTTSAFAGDDVIDSNGLDRAFTPTQVLTAADPYILTEISASNLPS